MSPAAPVNSNPRLPATFALLMAVASLGLAPAAGADAGISITATPQPGEIPIGASVTVAGRIVGEPAALAGRTLQLEGAPYPYRTYASVAQTQSTADGSFAFPATAPSENTRIRVSIPGSPGVSSPVELLTVDPRVAIHARSLGPGRERLSIRIEHTPSPHRGTSSVLWYLALRHSRIFDLAATSQSREIAPGVTYASAIVNPPATRFSYRVCLNPDWEAAMGPASAHGSCPARDFRLASAI